VANLNWRTEVGMNTPALILTAILCGLLLSCGQSDVEEGQALYPAESAVDRPNFLIIIADDLGYNEVGSHNNPVVKTPNINRLSEQGLSFNRAFVPASMCSPSRATLYTGLYPHRNGMSRNHARARDDVKSLPHYLTGLGYRSVLVGKSHVKPFEAFPFERLERDLDDVSDYLDAIGGDPFAMVIAQHHPHVPWLPNKHYDPDKVQVPEKLLDTPETREAIARYYTSVSAGDEELGAYLALLRQKGMASNTIIIFVSDHGPQFPFAKFSNYDASLRVPLIVHWPGAIEGGAHSDALVSTADILPTLIELAGGDPTTDFDGRSLVPLIEGETDSVHDAVFGTHSTMGLNIKDVKPYGIRTVRTKQYRYIKNLHPQNLPRSLISEPRLLRGSINYLRTYGVWVEPGLPKYWKSWLEQAKHDQKAADLIELYFNRPAEELYDLENDPQELRNLAHLPEYRDVADQLKLQLICWMRQQGDQEVGLIEDSSLVNCKNDITDVDTNN